MQQLHCSLKNSCWLFVFDSTVRPAIISSDHKVLFQSFGGCLQFAVVLAEAEADEVLWRVAACIEGAHLRTAHCMFTHSSSVWSHAGAQKGAHWNSPGHTQACHEHLPFHGPLLHAGPRAITHK